MKEKILVSACLLGAPCRYDGRAKPSPEVIRLSERFDLVPVCPEVAGGLPTPRTPSEIAGERVVSRAGEDVTAAFARGAAAAVQTARLLGITRAVLKARSPSCGRDAVYDGTFSGTLTAGDGVTAAALRAAGVRIFTEEETAALLATTEDTE